MSISNINPDNALIGVSAPKRILQSVLTALNEGKIPEAVDQFEEPDSSHSDAGWL